MTDWLPMVELMCHDWCEAVMTVKVKFSLISAPGTIGWNVDCYFSKSSVVE